MTSEELSKISDDELYSLRLRFIQLFNKWFKNNNRQKVGNLERNNFLDQYRLLLKEMNKRKLTHGVQSIDRALFRKNVYGINTSSLGDIVKVPDYVSIGGGFVKSPKDANDLDLIVREDERNRDEGLELKLSRLMQKQIEKECHFVYNETGAHSTYIPLFDLVLRSKNRINRVEIKEDYSKSEEIEKGIKEYYEGLDEWKQDFIYDFAEMAKNLEGKTILDLGCGTGRVMRALINSDYYNYQVDGLDNNDFALGMCKKKGLEVKKVDLEKGKLPYEDNYFCNVIGLHILEHLKNPDEIIKEAIRVAENKVIFISPLLKRLDPTHKQAFIKIDDFKALFDKNAEIKMVDHGDNTAIAIIKVAKIKKADNLKPFGSFLAPKPTMAGITESFSVDEIWDWCKNRI